MQKVRRVTPISPQQARSRETQEAILSFYGRFPDKDALLLFWYERFFKRAASPSTARSPTPEFKSFAAQLRLPALERLAPLLGARQDEWLHPDPTPTRYVPSFE